MAHTSAVQKKNQEQSQRKSGKFFSFWLGRKQANTPTQEPVKCKDSYCIDRATD